jgi:hypothetical protein
MALQIQLIIYQVNIRCIRTYQARSRVYYNIALYAGRIIKNEGCIIRADVDR